MSNHAFFPYSCQQFGPNFVSQKEVFGLQNFLSNLQTRFFGHKLRKSRRRLYKVTAITGSPLWFHNRLRTVINGSYLGALFNLWRYIFSLFLGYVIFGCLYPHEYLQIKKGM